MCERWQGLQMVLQKLESHFAFGRSFKLLVCSEHLQKTNDFSCVFDKNLPRAARHPFKHCTSLWQVGDLIFLKVLSFSGLISIPLWLTMKHKIFPNLTPKAHLEGLSRTLWNLILAKARSRSLWWSTSMLDFTNMSSKYASIVSFIILANNLLIFVW